MSEPLPSGAERRQSPRVTSDLPVRLQGRSPGGATLAGTGRTLNVSQLGAMLETAVEFARGTEVLIEDPTTGAHSTYRVVWVVSRPESRWEMGVELVRGEPLSRATP